MTTAPEPAASERASVRAALRTPPRTLIKEKGESIVDLTLPEAMELQDLRFCRVTPTAVEGRWRITDVGKVGVAVVAGRPLHIVPKTPLENIVYLASLGGHQLHVDRAQVAYGADAGIPLALARAFLAATEEAARRGLVKGYRSVQESAAVVRGRWDVSRQLASRPGIALPLEIEFDDFTEDIAENRILASAVRVLSSRNDVARALDASLGRMRALFAEVTPLPRGVPLPVVTSTRLTPHYDSPLRLARVVLEAVSWTHRDGAYGGGTFLVDMAAVFESYVANRLGSRLASRGLRVTAQDRRWWLDADRSVALRPDIVIAADAITLTVADTKYKVLGGGGSVPNGDVYQAVAYALALGVPTAHLIYVSGDVAASVIDIPVAGVLVHVHALPLAGSVEQIDATVDGLADSIVIRPA